MLVETESNRSRIVKQSSRHLPANKTRLAATPKEHATHTIHALTITTTRVSTIDHSHCANNQPAHPALVHNLTFSQTFNGVVFRQRTAILDSRVLRPVNSPAYVLA